MHALIRVAVSVAAVAALAGCGDDDGGDSDKDRITTEAVERGDPPVRPPSGWRTVTNRFAGFTISAPVTWAATTTPRRTVIRSDDRLVALSISADRTDPGRGLSAADYARRTIRTLPKFVGVVDKGISRVPGSKYQSAVLSATGTVSPSNLSQRITVAIFTRPGLVTYGVLVFRNAGVKPRFNDRIVSRMLRSLRAQRPSR